MRMPSAHAADEVATYQVKMEVAIPFYNESIAVLKDLNRSITVYRKELGLPGKYLLVRAMCLDGLNSN